MIIRLLVFYTPSKPASSATHATIFTATTTNTITTLPPPPQQQSVTESELAEHVAALEKKLSDIEQTNKNLYNTTQNLGSRVFTLELRDLPHKIDEVIRENVKEAVQIAIKAPFRERFRDLPKADMKEMIQQWMFETDNVTIKTLLLLYQIRISIRGDDITLALLVHHSLQLPSHLLGRSLTQMRRHWFYTSFKVQAEARMAKALATTYQAPAEKSLLEKTMDMQTFMHWIDISKPLPLSGPPGLMKAARYLGFGLEVLVPEYMWINEVFTYDLSASYGISHWWFNRQKFYIDRHTADSSRKLVKTHMRIFSVVSIKAYSRYGYDYLKESTLRRADYQEYTIAERDFKNLNLLLLQGQLNHLSGSGKRMLSTAVNLWTRNLDAKGFEYKHEYMIIKSPRAVVFPVGNNEQNIMRFNEIYKFINGTLTNIMEELDFRVKEYKINRLNSAMNMWFWTDKNVARSKEFIHAIEWRLKTRRIYQNLECFIDGRVRDIYYRLLQRTE
ncbi:hypothetical protein Tco_1410871 [Tanacetum coccineum]